jgi:hypothetical protein
MATALLHCSLPSLRTRRGIVRSPARASPLLSNACCAHSTPQAFFTARSSRTTSQLDVRTHAATQDSGLSAADPSRWITGATPNAPLIRFVALLGALALASQGKVLGATVKSLSFVHLLAWAAWCAASTVLVSHLRKRLVTTEVAAHTRCRFGTMFYTTFVAGIAMFKQLPRQTFRDVQECVSRRSAGALVVLPNAPSKASLFRVASGSYSRRTSRRPPPALRYFAFSRQWFYQLSLGSSGSSWARLC